VVHSLDLIPPPTRLPLVVTVHDVVTADLPEMHPARSRRMQRAQLAALPRAAAVLAVSSTTAGALAERGVTQDRIYVTPNGLSRFPAPVDPPIPPGPFVLVVGSLEPRKGHELLLRALARASLDHVRVVFAGPDGGREEEIRQLAARLGLDDRLRLLGRVDDAVLAGLYRDAAALCLPSHGEGFGLPVLEAMSFGTAVLASDLPALHEVAGDAALFAAVGEETEWSRQLQRVLGDDALRQQLGRQGRQRAELFSWDATAAETVRAYRAAIGQR
jgi:glycosyltransferase involved in cell wall biosynthesis